MKLNKHITPDQFKSLLQGDPDEQQIQLITDHLDSCTQCQQTMDALAAKPQLWAKASKLISGSFDLGSVSNHASSITEVKGDATKQRDECDSIQHMLDSPSHPEMMGRIGSYDIEREVGRGGMGIVFKAFDTELNRPLAIKVLAPWLARNGTARERFEREARAAAAVLHPNVVSIYGVNSRHKTPYLVMPYVAGPSLQRLIDEHGPLQEKDVVRIALQVAAGLTAAHAQGLVHRDIKPANILVEADVSRVLVTDFGLARAVDDASATQSGYFVGTPNYMSPEQALGQSVDARSDLFSLGSVIYFMATGRMPFRAESPLCVLNRISHDEPTSVRQVNSDVSKTLSDVIAKLLEKKPEHRFSSAGELHDVLEKYLAFLHQPDVSKPPVITSGWLNEEATFWSQSAGTAVKAVSAGLLLALAADFATGRLKLPSFATTSGTSDSKASEPSKGFDQSPAAASWAGSLNLDNAPESDKSSNVKWEPDSSGSNSGAQTIATEASKPVSSGWPDSGGDAKNDLVNAGITAGKSGEISTVIKQFSGGVVDGYSIYLPRSYSEASPRFPILICLQGGNTIGGEVSCVEEGLYYLLHKQHDPRENISEFLQDSMIIVCPHIAHGEYYDQATAMKQVVDEMIGNYRADATRVYLSGISRGGSGVWGLASRMPNVFSAVAPLAGNVRGIKDLSLLAKTPMWVAHNKGDEIFIFDEVKRVVEQLDESSSERFHRIDPADTTTPEDIEHSKVFSIGQRNDHNAWDDVYNNVDFFKWLLKQRR